MADDVLRFGKIEIIEWLRPGEMKTGRELFDEVEPMGIVSTPAVGAQYRQVWTRAEFLAAVREIENEFIATRMLPLLHSRPRLDERTIMYCELWSKLASLY